MKSRPLLHVRHCARSFLGSSCADRRSGQHSRICNKRGAKEKTYLIIPVPFLDPVRQTQFCRRCASESMHFESSPFMSGASCFGAKGANELLLDIKE